jgi:hypothetical protein
MHAQCSPAQHEKRSLPASYNFSPTVSLVNRIILTAIHRLESSDMNIPVADVLNFISQLQGAATKLKEGA